MGCEVVREVVIDVEFLKLFLRVARDLLGRAVLEQVVVFLLVFLFYLPPTRFGGEG